MRNPLREFAGMARSHNHKPAGTETNQASWTQCKLWERAMPMTRDKSNIMDTVQAVGSGHAANQARQLKPHHIPKWIVTHPADQSSPQGISHNVTSRSHQCFFASNSTVMKTWHPEPPTGRTNLASHTATCRLQTIDQTGQVIRLTKLDQPVRVIRHQHPCQHAAVP